VGRERGVSGVGGIVGVDRSLGGRRSRLRENVQRSGSVCHVARFSGKWGGDSQVAVYSVKELS